MPDMRIVVCYGYNDRDREIEDAVFSILLKGETRPRKEM
jgi:hypothetical protein